MSKMAELAQKLAQARIQGQPLPSSFLDLPASLSEGYHLQDLVHDHLQQKGWGHLAGYKIGCTTPVMQSVLGIAHPCAGGLFDRCIYPNGATLFRSRFTRLGIECEIAVRLGHSLLPSEAPFSRNSVASAVSQYLPAIELVDDRYRNWPRPETSLLIADDFYGAGAVLGTPKEDVDPDALAAMKATLVVDGRPVGTGTADSVMGHPLEALAWLANHLSEQGRPLPAGSFVLLGSLVAVFWVPPGSHRIEVRHDPLGTVALQIED